MGVKQVQSSVNSKSSDSAGKADGAGEHAQKAEELHAKIQQLKAAQPLLAGAIAKIKLAQANALQAGSVAQQAKAAASGGQPSLGAMNQMAKQSGGVANSVAGQASVSNAASSAASSIPKPTDDQLFEAKAKSQVALRDAGSAAAVIKKASGVIQSAKAALGAS